MPYVVAALSVVLIVLSLLFLFAGPVWVFALLWRIAVTLRFLVRPNCRAISDCLHSNIAYRHTTESIVHPPTFQTS